MSLTCAVLLHCHRMEGEELLLQNLDLKGCSLLGLSSEITDLAFYKTASSRSYLYQTVLFALGFEFCMEVMVGEIQHCRKRKNKGLVKIPGCYRYRKWWTCIPFHLVQPPVGLRSVSSSVEEMFPLPCHWGCCGVTAPALSQDIILLSLILQRR